MAQLIKKPEIIADEHVLLTIEIDGPAPLAGQFVNIKTGTETDPLIRRPFSVYNYRNNQYELVIRIVGRGTEMLSNMEPGAIDIIGPFGREFSLLENKSALLVGGGVGNAPLFYLARKLKEKNTTVSCIYGAASKNYIYKLDEFQSVCDSVHVTTDDGSEGFKGYATDLMRQIMSENSFSMIYTCGPEIMMKGVCALSGDTPVEVSLENYFGCGVGICSGCVFDTPDGYKRACIDGPVYDGKKIIWA